MTISIIIPVYNCAAYIKGCIRSIQEQSCQDWDCICVNDGSSDESGEILREIAAADPRIRIIEQENQGQSVARNTGLNEVTGDYICFVDADDYIHPRMLELLLHAVKTTSAPLAGCDIGATSKIYAPIAENNLGFIKTTLSHTPLQAYMSQRRIATSVSTKIYHRSLIEHLRFIPGIFFEDAVWTVHLMARIPSYAHVQATLYYYYCNPDSTMRSRWNEHKTESVIHVIDAIHDDIASLSPEEMPQVARHILNPHVKMIFNRIKKLPTKEQDKHWLHLTPLLQRLFSANKISYTGLKLKHRLRLWRLLRA